MSTTINKPDYAGAADLPEHNPLAVLGYALLKGIKALASLQLTVVLFSFSILLVFFGTLAQVDNGIWTVVDKYFYSIYVMVPFELLHKFGQVFLADQFPKDASQWGGSFPLPGGLLLGLVMFVNLLAAHAIRFKLSWKRIGILLIHSGMILLLFGELITREFAIEQRMTIDEGAAVSFAEDTRHYELAIVDKSDTSSDTVTVIPASMLRKAESRIANPELPVDIEVVKYMSNSKFKDPEPGKKNLATAGRAVQPRTAAVAVEVADVNGVDTMQTIDNPSAYIRLYKKGTDESIGTYLVSLLYSLQKLPDEFEVDGKKYQLSLRLKRYYKPFSVHLNKFSFDRYPGTQKPKNYSSDIKLVDKDGRVREQTIRMNEPMRHEGETFYQADFNHDTEKGTVLQVVKNPGWLLPYISCVMVGLGLLTHFSIGLILFLKRKGRGAAPPLIESASIVAPSDSTEPVPAKSWLDRNFEWLIPTVMVVVAIVYLGSVYGRMKPKDQFDLDTFSRLPVLEGGHVKPLDSVARVYLRKISHQSVYKDAKGDEQPAIRWYLETLGAKPSDESEPAWSNQIVRIESDQLLAELKLPLREGLRYSFNELRPKLQNLDEKARKAIQKKRAGKPLDLFETKILDLFDKIELLFHIADGRGHDTTENQFHLIPPQAEGESWVSLGEYRAAAEEAAFASAMTTARARVRAQPGNFDRIAEDFLLSKIVGEEAAHLSSEERKTYIDMVMANDPARLPPDARGKLLNLILSLLPKDEQESLRSQYEADLQTRLKANPGVAEWDRMIEAHRKKKYEDFNSLVKEYRDKYTGQISTRDREHANLEINYNRFAPFLRCIGLYVIAFLLSAFGFAFKASDWPRLGESFRRSAVYVLLLTFLIHLFGLFVRMDLMNYTLVFVTNLYSSAIFIGCGCVGLGLILERLFPIGIGAIVASVLGVATTIVAHNLATEDTLEMMQAVLDTNFWLATHVTTVTLGYTATFVAGFLGAAYAFMMFCSVIRDSFKTPGQPTADRLLAYGAAALGIVIIPLSIGWVLLDALAKFEYLHSGVGAMLRFGMVAAGGVYFAVLLVNRASADGVDSHGKPTATPIPRFARPVAGMGLNANVAKILGQMIYGVVCFAMMLSFIGTVLGGIWADQSWGRFWGWDPKENGAVLIVLWNALILHARWCGLVKTRGMAILAICGNMITAWSWFGTNQLGGMFNIGLHSYGFDSRLADGCFNFWLSMSMIAVLGLIPQRFWSTNATATAIAVAQPVVHERSKKKQRP